MFCMYMCVEIVHECMSGRVPQGLNVCAVVRSVIELLRALSICG